MTRWILPDAAFAGNDSESGTGLPTDTSQNMSDMVRRINKAYNWPTRAVNQLGVIRASTSGNYYLMLSDSDYADLVSKSGGSVGLSTTEQSNSVTSAPAGDQSSSFYPYAVTQPWPRKVVYCVGDSITNGIVYTHAENEKLPSRLLDPSDSPQYVTISKFGYSWDKTKVMAFNFGRDSYQVKNPNGQPYGDWYTDFPLKLSNVRVAPSQMHIFHFHLGTNDLAHETGIDTVTELWTNRVAPMVAMVKSMYPLAKVYWCKILARGTSTALNNRIKAFNDYLEANYASIGLDGFNDYQNVTGTGVWSTVKIFDCNNPGVTVSRSNSITVSSISGSTFTTSASYTSIATTGMPVTVSSSANQPGGIAASTTYFIRSLTSTTLSLHPTLADAVAGTNVVTPTSSGTGTITILSTASIVSSISGSTFTTSSAYFTSAVTGIPVNITSNGTMPGGLDANTPYYARGLTTTTFTLHPTLADANANTNAITPSSAGSGTIIMSTSGDLYYSIDGVHPKPAGTGQFGAESKRGIDLL